jgi:hypothetical protein
MANQITLEQIEQLATQLSPPEQLKLVARLCEELSVTSLGAPIVVNEEVARQQREQEADAILALCDAAAEMWEGEFDAAEDIRQMRQDRDKQIWLNKS